ncbi:MAG: hypothetical protein WC719_00765 [Patescibacteria group bacterium]|jgi:hypothetical protein
MSTNQISAEKELRKFLERAHKLLGDSQKNENDCYMILYHMRIISEAFKDGDENLATLLSAHLTEDKEEFRFCATDDDFYKLTNEIEMNIGRVLDTETPTGNGSGINLGQYLHFMARPDPCQKKEKR